MGQKHLAKNRNKFEVLSLGIFAAYIRNAKRRLRCCTLRIDVFYRRIDIRRCCSRTESSHNEDYSFDISERT